MTLWLALKTAMILVGCAIAMTLISRPVFAADHPTARSEVLAPAPESKIEVIAAANIPARADSDDQFAGVAIARTRAADVVPKFEQPLKTQAARIQELIAKSDNDDLAALPVRRLETVRRHWQLLDRSLADWRAGLQKTIKVSSDDAAGMAARRVAWTAVQTAAIEAAPALQQRATEVMAKLDAGGMEVGVRLGELLELNREADALSAKLQSSLAAVTARIEDEDRRLTSLDSVPLWQVTDQLGAIGRNSFGVVENLSVETALAKDYDAARAKPLRVLATGCILLLPILLWLRTVSRRLVSTNPASEVSLQALARPWAAWFVLVAAAVVLYDLRGPVLRQQIVLLLAWGPVLRLLPSQMMKDAGRWAYLSAAFYCMTLLASLVVGSPTTYRFTLLAIDLLMATTAGVLWLRSRTAASVVPPEPHRNAMRLIFFVISSLSIAAAVSNLIGNVSLAEMLTAAMLDSSYVALAIYAGAVVFAAFFRVALAWVTASRFATSQVESLVHLAAAVGRAVLVMAWLVFAARSLRIYGPLSEMLRTILSRELTVGAVSLSLGSLVALAVSAWLAFWLAKTIRLLLAEDVLPALSLPLGVGHSIATLSYYTVLFLGLLTSLALAGFQVGQLAIVFGALGVGIGFGLQDVVKNFVSGLILMFERPLRPGDVVDVAATYGTVRGIGLRATTITTFEGADVVVPNGMLLADKLVNWTLRGNRRRIDVSVSTGYDAPPQHTIDLLVAAARELEGIAPTPEPMAILTGLARGALEFNVRAWTTDRPDWLTLRSNLALSVHKALAGAGIQVPKPQSEVHLGNISAPVLQALATLRPAP